MEYPKVLVVTTSPFNRITGTGILLANLFAGWPKDNLANICGRGGPSDPEICRLVYRIGLPEFVIFGSISTKGLRGRRDGAIQANDGKLCREEARWKRIARQLGGLLNWILGGEEVYLKRVVSDRLGEWVRRFNPDVVYCHAATLGQIGFLKRLKKEFNIPFCIHIMDDWASTVYESGLFARMLKRRFDTEFREFLADCKIRMTIGFDMSRAYKQRYGLEFLFFPNVIVSDEWEHWSKNSHESGNTFKIIYAGIVDPEKNVLGLELMSRIVQELAASHLKIEFHIYTFAADIAKYRPMFGKYKSVYVAEVPSSDRAMAELLSSGDLLYIPTDFTPNVIAALRFSIYAKFPVYMISGVPVLVFGPSEIASTRYAQEGGWAFVVTLNEADELKQALRSLQGSAELRARLGRNGRIRARLDFDAISVRTEFHRRLRQALVDDSSCFGST